LLTFIIASDKEGLESVQWKPRVMARFSSLLEYYRFEKARRRLTQEDLRKRWGLKCQSHVHALIYGKCRPKLELARVIAKDTGIDLLVLLGGKKDGRLKRSKER
jgi:hypothetical protein